MHSPHSIGKYLIWLALLAVLAAGIYALSMYEGMPDMQDTEEFVIEQPPFTEEIAAQLAASKGFAALVSYTQSGFEPETVTIEAGEAVRFTNNSPGEMWVAASTEMGSIYPGRGICGQSPFDVCKAIAPGMFWEFTFEEEGTWGYHDNSNPAKTGAVIVQ